MCGICGKLTFESGNHVSAALVKAMADAVRHRGPDDEGVYVSGQIGLGFRRLSIIDLDGGSQPLSNEDGTVWIVFNGEIYNYRALREDLITKGHICKTRSDTEVIVHLYEEYGTACVSHLRGMFAFAIWDCKRKTLFLARDRVGIKPLYYYCGRGFLSFGSEIKAILADPAVQREVDPAMIDRFLAYYYVPGGQTLLKNLFKLEPGHTLVVGNGECDVCPYWDLEFSEPDRPQSQSDVEARFLTLLDETVQLRLVSDVPIGFLLSGGLDSTAMLSFAAKKMDMPLSTFTIGFSSEGIVDERPFARLAAQRYGSKHYEISISPQQFLAFLPKYVWHMEEPVCQPPALALYYVSKLASQYVKVLISGEGGDEAFAGYENYRNTFWFEKIKAALGALQQPIGDIMSLCGELLQSRVLSKYGPRMRAQFDQYYLSRTSSPYEFFTQHSSMLYTDAMMQVVDRAQSVRVTSQLLKRAWNYSLLNKMLYVDTKTWLPDELLVKADKMTMANSVELRVPLLDHKVLEFAATLPRKLKIRGWTMKYLVRKALGGHLPREIVTRRKAGFPVPYDLWLRRDCKQWVADILLDPKTISRGYFRKNAIEDVIVRNRNEAKYAKEIFSLVVLELWHRAFTDQTVYGSSGSEALARAENLEAIGNR
jgi:asparagine synthase (glutamine-hydrolysing)